MERFVKLARRVKCKKCGKSELCYKDTLKKVNICENCIEDYKKTRINCTVCKKSFKRDKEYFAEDSKFKTKNFCCEECYNKYVAEEEEKDKMDKWLKEYFKVDTLPSRIYMQMEDFKTKKNISYKWCFTTLRYIVSIQGNTLQEGTIGVVPYVVDECKRYVTEINERNKKAKKQGEQNKTRFTDNVIKIKTTNIDRQREENINKMLIKEEDLKGVILW